MKLQTKVPLKRAANNLISYASKLFLLGSCFSENIGSKLSYYKFQSNQNPFGILFHPKAIENLIARAINNNRYTAEELIFNNERWHCFDAHSSVSSAHKNELLMHLNAALTQTRTQLETATHISITLGTSWVYRHLENNQIVANCHKFPQKEFSKELLTVAEVSESLAGSIALIQGLNAKASITFTVSPVRHLKDGFIENTRSKAHLIAGIHAVVCPKNNIHYFPSYEIVMDELRDYRFYSEDLLHLNKTAITYIWEKFTSTWFSEETQTTMEEVAGIQKGIAHRAFNEDTEQHRQFLKNLELKKKMIYQKHPFITF